MHEQDARGGGTEDLRALNELAVSVRKRAVPGDAREARDEEDAQGDDDGIRSLPLPEHRDHDQREQDSGEGVERVDQAHDALVRGAAEIPRRQAENRAEKRSDAHGARRHEKREFCARHHAAENIPAEIVRSE